MTDVLANSDNVAMVWVMNKLGSQQMDTYLQAFGFGQPTGIDLKNEASGSILPLNQWHDINRATIAFGQGISVTPLQVINAYAALINSGLSVSPHIVKAQRGADGQWHEVTYPKGKQVVTPKTSAEIRDMMVATVDHAHKKAGTPGYRIGGKTGTAQIPDPNGGGYLPDDQFINHSFIGMGPADNPQYLVLVKIDQPNIAKVGQYAESTAVPAFKNISDFLLNYYQIPPSN